MKKMVQKSLVLMLVLILMVSACAIPAFAVEVQSTTICAQTENAETDFACVVLSDGTIEIAGYIGTSKKVVIPSVIDGRKVTSIGNSAFFKSNSVTEVTVPSGVTKIGSYAFGYSDSIKKVTIPSSVTSIAQNAFINHPSDLVIYCFNETAGYKFVKQNSIDYVRFKYIELGDGLAEIIASHGDVEKVEIPETIDGYVVASIGNSAFMYSCVTDVTIPGSVTKIDDYAFCWCSSLKSIKMPERLTYLGDYAFAYCSSLTDIEIPQGMRWIGVFTFGQCSSLESVTIPDGVEYILDYAFYRCSSLESVTVPSSVEYTCDTAFMECSDSLTING